MAKGKEKAGDLTVADLVGEEKIEKAKKWLREKKSKEEVPVEEEEYDDGGEEYHEEEEYDDGGEPYEEEVEEEYDDGGEEIEVDLPPITMQAVLEAYLQVRRENGKGPSRAVLPVGEVYAKFGEKGYSPGDFADALASFVENGQESINGYRCDLEVKGEEFHTLSFVKIDRKAPAPMPQPLPPPPPQEVKTYPQMLDILRKEYDKQQALCRAEDQRFFELEQKRLREVDRWEICQKILQIERATADPKVAEQMAALRAELGYPDRQ